ncbi:hypothetical protein Tco_0394879 [Tanacetum coccineum]
MIALVVHKLDLEPLSPKLKNIREAHVYYIRISKENADTLCDIAEQARTSNPLDNALAYALGLHQLTPGYISSGLVQNLYFNCLPRAVSPDPVAIASPRAVDLAGSPSSNYH